MFTGYGYLKVFSVFLAKLVVTHVRSDKQPYFTSSQKAPRVITEISKVYAHSLHSIHLIITRILAGKYLFVTVQNDGHFYHENSASSVRHAAVEFLKFLSSVDTVNSSYSQ